LSSSTPPASARSPRSRLAAVAPALAVGGLVVVFDQVTKWLVRREADDLPLDLGWGFGVRLLTNPGVSFGRLTGSADAVLIAVGVLVVVLLVALFVVPARYRLGLGVLLGGAAGNLIDRLRSGAVVDFVDVPWWPTFNVADVAVVVGVILVVWAMLRAELA
jgi:signal peptidase II